jgi:hypothetical protein
MRPPTCNRPARARNEKGRVDPTFTVTNSVGLVPNFANAERSERVCDFQLTAGSDKPNQILFRVTP